MLPVYVFCAILGGGLLLLGMLGSQKDVGGHPSGDLDLAADKSVGWTKLLSVRTAAYTLAGFGLTGAGLTLAQRSPGAALGFAIAMGVFGGGLATALFSWVRGGEGGFAESSQSYIGEIGRTEVRIPSGGRGRIHLVRRGRAFTLPAVTSGDEIDRLEPVLVIDVVEGVAVVERAPGELTE